MVTFIKSLNLKGSLYRGIIMISFMLTGIINPVCVTDGDHKTLPIVAIITDFNLPCVDGKTYSLSSLKKQSYWLKFLQVTIIRKHNRSNPKSI